MKFPPWRRRREEELEEKIQSHLRMAIRDRMQRGESAKEAESAARREFGNVGLIKETTRGMWGFAALETFWQDLRYGARMLLKQPGFTSVAILTLALGIGANTAIFSVVNSVLLRPLAVAQPERLVRIRLGGSHTSFPNFRDLAEQTEAFSAVAAHSVGQFNLGQGETKGKVLGELVTGSYFPTLGVPAALGRTFGTETDGATGAHPVVVVSYGFWRRRFGADPGLLGQTILLNGGQFTVIGVMPEGFHGTWPFGITPEAWAPVTMWRQLRPGADRFGARGNQWLEVFGRLKPEISPPQAQAAVNLAAKRLAEAYPEENRGLERTEVYPLSETRGANFLRVIPVFLGLVTVIAGMVLLIACANVANLLLARAVLRRQEVAIRLQGLKLTLIGVVLGCAVALGITRFLTSLLVGVSAIDPVTFLAVPVLLTTVASLACWIPARRATKVDPMIALRRE